MKVVAFNGSPRKNGNTALLINQVFTVLAAEKIECELINIYGKISRGCMACGKCRQNLDRRCVVQEDSLNQYIEKMLTADGIIIGSPTYFANLTTETKALIDRAGYVVRGNGNLLKRKVGAAVVVARRAGFINVFNAINDFFLLNEMIVPGSSYWNLGIGGPVGSVAEDEEGRRTVVKLGENMAWVLKRVAGNSD